MKRFITGLGISLSLVALALPADAQKVSLGFKGGANIAKLGGSDVSDTKSFIRLIGGGFGVIELSPNVALQPELLYAQKGTKFDVGTDISAMMKLDYFEVPLLLRVQPAGPRQVLPHAFAGPTIAFKTSCKIAGESGSASAEVDCNQGDLKVPIKDVDYGLAFGAGVETALGRVFLGLDARYVLGLTTIDSTSDNPDNVKNRAFGIMASVRFPLGSATRVAAR